MPDTTNPQSFTARKPTEDTWKAIQVANKLGGSGKDSFGTYVICVRHKHVSLNPSNIEVKGFCWKCRIEQLAERGLACKKHWTDFSYTNTNAEKKCYHCEWELKNKSADWNTEDLAKLTHLDTSNFIAARKRYWINILSEEEAKTAVRAVVAVIGKPKLNTTWDQSGNQYDHRVILWAVKGNVEGGVLGVNALVSNGIKEFKVTSGGYLTVWIPKELTVREILKKAA